ncbi:hypothetical protein ASPTUDRAFT_43611, partial [Aspergillus tubingensis CBS 134.48]
MPDMYSTLTRNFHSQHTIPRQHPPQLQRSYSFGPHTTEKQSQDPQRSAPIRSDPNIQMPLRSGISVHPS